jgi:hypothetical protein
MNSLTRPREGTPSAIDSILEAKRHFNIDDDRYFLTEPDAEEVVITASLLEKRIMECQSLVLWGGSYPDITMALNAGRKWRQIITAVLARLGIGCDFGRDDESTTTPVAVTEAHILGMFDLSPGKYAYRDLVGLLVFPTTPQPLFVNVNLDVVGVPAIDTLSKLIVDATERYNGLWSDQLRLAYELIHAALAEINPESRCILTVTAIEALIPYREKHPILSQILDFLIDIVDELSEFDADTRDATKQLLRYDKMKSIGKFGRELASRLPGLYAGLPPKKYFAEQYGIRSSLTHGNIRDNRKLSKDGLNQQFRELLRFVLDILEHWDKHPGFDV